MLAAGALWVLLDFTRGLRVLQWLREDDVSDVPLKLGLWGVVAERVRRMVRLREQATRESDRRLQDFLAALQASPNGVVLLDAAGRIEWLNQTAAAHFGLDPQRDQLQHLVNLVRDPGFAAYVSGGDYSASVTMPGRGHTAAHPLRLSVHLHPYGEGRRLLLSRDITALFEQAEAMRRDFVANVSHEIRTPLTVLSGFVETLQTLPLDAAERARYLDLMAQQADRMQSLVSDLLMLSRLEGSPLPGAGEWSSVPLLMQQLEQEGRVLSAVLNPPMTGPAQQLTFESTRVVRAVRHCRRTAQCPVQPLSNAVRYTPPAARCAVAGWCTTTVVASSMCRTAAPASRPSISRV